MFGCEFIFNITILLLYNCSWMQQVGRKPVLPHPVTELQLLLVNQLLSLRQTHYKLLHETKPLNSGEAYILVSLDVGDAAQLPWVVRKERDQVSHKHYYLSSWFHCHLGFSKVHQNVLQNSCELRMLNHVEPREMLTAACKLCVWVSKSVSDGLQARPVCCADPEVSPGLPQYSRIDMIKRE